MYEKIEQYLNGELSIEDRSNFEAEMAADDELASTVKLYSAIDRNMRNNERFSEDEKELKKTLNKLNANYFKSEPAPLIHEKKDQ